MANETVISAKDLERHRAAISEQMDQLAGKKIIVIGDIGLDEYVMGDVRRISPEAPVPVLEVNEQDARVGLAANVAQNVRSLGGEPFLVGVVGTDSAAGHLKELLEKAEVSPAHLVEDSTRPTTRKMRAMTGHHHIVRVDYERRQFLANDVEVDLINKVNGLMDQCDGVVIEDYGKGVMSAAACQKIIALAHASNKKVLVDPHRTTPLSYYKGADLFKPNRDEAFILSGLNLDDLRQNPSSIHEVGAAITEQVGCEHLVITQGKEGMSLYSEGNVQRLPTYARQVFDVTGAGDTVLASIALGWFGGFSLDQACVFANYAAGVVVGKVGCVPCHKSELMDYIEITCGDLS